MLLPELELRRGRLHVQVIRRSTRRAHSSNGPLMEAALAAFEEYGAQLAEVQEGLRLDPDNEALKELLIEIARNIEKTEAQLEALQSAPGESAASKARREGEESGDSLSEQEEESGDEDEFGDDYDGT